MLKSDEFYLDICLKLASRAAHQGEVPVGALIVDNQSGAILSKAQNLRERLQSPLGHAEILCIHKTSRILGTWRLNGHSLYTNLEPCVMCSGVIVQSRLDRVVFSAPDPKGGGQSLFGLLAHPGLNHQVRWEKGPYESQSRELIQGFFRKRRKP